MRAEAVVRPRGGLLDRLGDTVVPGWLLMLAVSLVSMAISRAIVVAILIGIALRNLRWVPRACHAGISAFERVLAAGIVLLGAGFTVGMATPSILIVLIVTMISAFLLILILARLMGFSGKLSILLAVGTTICGGTAIAITSPLIEADREETGYAVGTIALWGLIAILVYPHLARLLGFSQRVFGVWVGTAIHSTPQVIGAGYIFGEVAGQVATITKLVRNIFMIPLAFLIALWYAKGRTTGEERQAIVRALPWFLFGYVAMALLRGFGFFTPVGIRWITQTGKFLILVAMAGIGLGSELRRMSRLGWRPLLAGFLASVIVALISLGAMDVAGIS